MKKTCLIVLISTLAFQASIAQTLLSADGEGNTYELITSVLAPGKNPIEVPDCNHEDFGRHIDEVYDTSLNAWVFRFHIHLNPDNDRCINFDRQRNEIKTYSGSPDSLLGVAGETFTYSWKFKIDSGFQSSSSFTHIHQLKAVGGSEESMPLITLTTRDNTPDQMELRYAKNTDQSTLTKFDLTDVKGAWMEVMETVKYGESGTYSIVISNYETKDILLNYSSNNIRMWKTGASFIRPKWGIYRSLNDSSILRDESVLFNDFYILEKIDLTAPTVSISTSTVDPIIDTFEIDVQFSEMVNNFTESDFAATYAEVVPNSLIGSGTSYTVSFTPTQSGIISIHIPEYTVSDEYGNGNIASDTLLLTADITNSISNQRVELQSSIYPNPIHKNNFLIQTAYSNNLYRIGIYNTHGKLIYTVDKPMGSSELIVDISNLSNGLYLIKIDYYSSSEIQTLIIDK